MDLVEQAKLLKVKANVMLHVVEAMQLLGEATAEGVDVTKISAYFFADSLFKHETQKVILRSSVPESPTPSSSSPLPEQVLSSALRGVLSTDTTGSTQSTGKNKRSRSDTSHSLQYDPEVTNELRFEMARRLTQRQIPQLAKDRKPPPA